ncbi:unnamed protein product, partial [Ixodes persulcatus]
VTAAAASAVVVLAAVASAVGASGAATEGASAAAVSEAALVAAMAADSAAAAVATAVAATAAAVTAAVLLLLSDESTRVTFTVFGNQFFKSDHSNSTNRSDGLFPCSATATSGSALVVLGVLGRATVRSSHSHLVSRNCPRASIPHCAMHSPKKSRSLKRPVRP